MKRLGTACTVSAAVALAVIGLVILSGAWQGPPGGDAAQSRVFLKNEAMANPLWEEEAVDPVPDPYANSQLADMYLEKSSQQFIAVGDAVYPVYTRETGEVIVSGLHLPTVDEVRQNGYPVNESGETYGPNVPEMNAAPDLVAAVGTGNVLGYVRESDFPRPETLDEALVLTEENQRGVVPLYMQDGETVIGEFEYG